MGLGAVLGLGSSLIGASSASKAAKAQTAAANADLALKERIYDETTERFQPYYDDGRQYSQVLNYLNGIGELPMVGGTAPEITTTQLASTTGRAPNAWTPGRTIPGATQYNVGGQTFDTESAAQDYANANKTGGTPYAGMQETDAYKFRVNQGVKAIDAGAAARGGLYSGKTLQDLQTFGQGQADQFENNYFSRISAGAAQGQAAAAQQAQAGQNYSVGAGNAYDNIGNAQAAGAIGVGNAFQGGINNGLGLYNYQNSLNGGQGGGSNWLFGGNSFS